MTMLMKQLKLHINFQYKAIIIFWIAALLIKGITSVMDLREIREGFLQHILKSFNCNYIVYSSKYFYHTG
ncbi:hypothetical protein B4147_2559 [Bacillus wiedmannii]|uniref:Uncharacterized protein n=1 Tax=Bacillus wiedmannii TaxID=1890302 RepID=A0A0G8C0I2_9BACI|nr:hypothetical protein B4147_2559 [Bacillus wiedmannii]